MTRPPEVPSHRGRLLRLSPNRVWRTYPGGRTLDIIEGRAAPADGRFPEDWIGSTVRAVNPGRHEPDEGLSRVTFVGGEARLADLIEADPVYFLGERHAARYGSRPMVLVKYLDSAVRLPFQVHPTPDFSRRFLGSESGKAEAYYVLGVRKEVAEPFLYLGFQRPPTREALRRMIVEQDMAALEACFDRIPIEPGDVYVVPGGFPHAIGAGIHMVEVMEPTDFVARVEFEVAGRVIPPEARFMGGDVEFALDMFSYQAQPVDAVRRLWAGLPRVVEEQRGLCRESLVDERTTDRFGLIRTRITGRTTRRADGFTIVLLVEGACTVTAGDEELALRPFDRLLVPPGLGEVRIEGAKESVFLECLPPGVGGLLPA